jgi:DNA-binding NtrC family response regulator
LKILLVDDDEMIRHVYKEMLTRAGHEVITGSDGMMAIQVMRENSDIEILITDNDMPEATGLEVLGEAMELIPNSRRFLMSGRLTQETVENAIYLRVEACLEKPIMMADFQKHGLLPKTEVAITT